MNKADWKDLAGILEGVQICFCTLCSHDKEYGHCYFCKCHNHIPEPKRHTKKDIEKLKASIDHAMKLIQSILDDLRAEREKNAP